MLSITRKYDGQDSLQQHLVATPGLAELYYYAQQAMQHRGRTISVTWWSHCRRTTMELTVSFNGSFRWRLIERSASQRVVRLETSIESVAIVHNIIVSTAGEITSTFARLVPRQFDRSTHEQAEATMRKAG